MLTPRFIAGACNCVVGKFTTNCELCRAPYVTKDKPPQKWGEKKHCRISFITFPSEHFVFVFCDLRKSFTD